MNGEKSIKGQHREVSVGHIYLFNIFLNDLHPTGLDNVSLTDDYC